MLRKMKNNDEKKSNKLYDVSRLTLDFSDLNKINWASEHQLGIAKNIDKEIKDKIMKCYNAECHEVGMYLTMARQAYREGYPEIGNVLKLVASEEAEHASRFLEMVQGPVSTSTESNLESLIKGEAAASLLRYEVAALSKQKGDAPMYEHVHDSVHEISRDEARHGKAFLGLLNRYFRNEK